MIEDIKANSAETLVATRRAEIEAAMARYLAASPEVEPTPEDDEAAAHLVEALIAALCDPAVAAAALAARPVARRYLSRFGDGLSAILKDVLGAAADSSFLSRAIDGYWRAVRAQPE